MASEQHAKSSELVQPDSTGFAPADKASRQPMLWVLALVLLLQAADAIVFSMAMGPIQRDLGLSDTQLGLLNGSAFALFYAVAAIPLARISDRGQRRNVIAACLALWSLFTALTSLAQGFAFLFLSRLLVGVGEAGATPAALSLVAARYPPHQRAGATSVVQAGKYLGMVIGLWGAGSAIAWIGWRDTFLLFGIPGLFVAGAMLFAIEEPNDLRIRKVSSLRETAAALDRRATRHLIALLGILSLVAAGTIAWAPLFYQRSFAMTPSEVGFWLGIAIGAGTVAGTLLGGLICNRLPTRIPGLWLAFWTLALNAPLTVLAFAVDNKAWSLSLLLASTVSGAVCMGPLFAALQTLTPPKVRATAVALISVVMVIAGQGVGPLLVGVVSDVAGAAGGGQGLKMAMISITALGFWPLYHAWRLAQLYRHDLQGREDDA